MKRGREPEPVPPNRPASYIPAAPSAPSAVQRVHVQPASQQQKLTTNDALSYLREVKNRFADRKQVYDTFLDIMKEFKAQRIDTHGVIVRVKKLFKGHRELILGFNTFLPKGYEIELARISSDEDEDEAPPKQAVEFDQAINYVNKIKTRFAADERVYKAFLEILNMYRKGQKNIHHVYSEVAVLFQHHPDLLNEFTYFLPDNSAQGLQMRQYMRAGGAAAVQAAGRLQGAPAVGARPPQVKGYGGAQAVAQQGMGAQGSPGVDHSRLMHKRKAARRAEEGFRRMDEEDGGYGGAQGARVARGSLAKELQFLEKVKARLRSREQYASFLKCLNMYSQDIISRQELVHLVADILGSTPDLMAQFQQFVSSCESMDMSELTGAGGAAGARGAQPMSNRDLLKAKLLKDKYLSKPLSEIVATETNRITPSYVEMPAGYPKLHQSGRTRIGDEVLNDLYVNVITGSEDYSFKLMRKNQYEEALFRCEDDRYEFDIACEQNLSAIRVLRPLADRIAAMSPDEKGNFSWHDCKGTVNSVHLAHIGRLYGDHSAQLLELLVKNPAVAIPIVLPRLEAKDAEWRKVKEEMAPTWQKIFEQNYPRSLDHRSFYFKQAEKKCMMTKVMVGEVKEHADKRKADEQHLRTLSMAHRHAIPAAASALGADLSFAYNDREVFEDVYVSLKTAIEHQLHAGHKEQVLQLFLGTIEPFMGLPERTDELKRIREQTEDPGQTPMEVMETSESSEQEDGKATPAPAGTPEPTGGEDGAAATDADEQGDQGQRRRRVGSADGGSEDGGSGKLSATYTQCKPIMPFSGDAQPAAAAAAAEGSGGGGSAQGSHQVLLPPGTRVLFANEHMYVFFRYHRYLYERLCAARKFSLEVATKKATAPVRGGGPLGLAPALDLEGRTPQPEVSEAAIKEDAERIHGQFLQCLRTMVNSSGTASSDIGAFEDQVRNLLGTNSYELFTLDKLLVRMVKHLQLMVTDDASHKLWDMYLYEHARGAPVSCSMYHINCHTVLDDTCYRVEYSDADHTLRFQQNDAERTDAYLAPEGALPAYMVTYVNTSTAPLLVTQPKLQAGESPDDHTRVFLRRNLRALDPELRRQARLGEAGLSGVAAQEAADEALATALQGVLVCNGLETKIACQTCKVSYVLDTEDVMLRAVRRHNGEAAERTRDQRVLRFSKWLTDKNEAADKRKQEEEEAAKALAGGVMAS